MTAAYSGPADSALEEAAEWFALLISGEAKPSDHDRWQAWLQESPGHREAWSYVEMVSQRIVAPVQSVADPRVAIDNLQAANERLRRRRRSLSTLLAIIGVGALGWTTWRHTPIGDAALALAADFHTDVGEVREVVMPDGTRVWLNTDTAFNKDYSTGLRRLEMLRGEVLITTAHDEARPFVVDTSAGRMRALGTRFTVRQEAEGILLAVYQGSVEIRTAGNGATAIVDAGRQASFNADGITPIMPADDARQAWSQGKLVANDVPLGELVEELRRYTRQHIGVDTDVASRRIFGTFPLDDINKSLNMVAYAARVQIRRPLPWWTTLKAVDTGKSP